MYTFLRTPWKKDCSPWVRLIPFKWRTVTTSPRKSLKNNFVQEFFQIWKLFSIFDRHFPGFKGFHYLFIFLLYLHCVGWKWVWELRLWCKLHPTNGESHAEIPWWWGVSLHNRYNSWSSHPLWFIVNDVISIHNSRFRCWK